MRFADPCSGDRHSICCCSLRAADAQAHSQSYGYLDIALDGATANGRFQAAVRDLDRLYHLDSNGDGSITWGEVRLRETEIANAALKSITSGLPVRPLQTHARTSIDR